MLVVGESDDSVHGGDVNGCRSQRSKATVNQRSQKPATGAGGRSPGTQYFKMDVRELLGAGHASGERCEDTVS